MEELWPKSHSLDVEISLSNSAMHENRNWAPEKRQQVLWTDESKCDIFGCSSSSTIVSVYRQQWSLVEVLWGWICKSANGVRDLVRISGVLSAEKYRQRVILHVIPPGRCLAPYWFCSRRTTPNIQPVLWRTVFSIKNRQVLEVMVWPPQIPDLNIIEAVWDHMKRQKHLRKICV